MKLKIKTQIEEKTIIILFSSQGTKGYQENSNLEAFTFYQAKWAGKVFSYCKWDIQHIINDEEKELVDHTDRKNQKTEKI